MLARLLPIWFAATALLVLPAHAQSGNLKSVIDDGLDELVRRQLPDGSYGDLVTTADAVLAFCEAPRRYGETDGPFFRKAIDWLAAQVGQDGQPRVDGDVHVQVAVAGWIDDALARSKRPDAIAARDRLSKFLASDAVKNRGEALLGEAEFERGFAFQAPPENLERELWPITQTLSSDRAITPAEFERILAPLLERTMVEVNVALDSAKERHGLTAADIDAFILVGGSSRIPWVGPALQERFKKPVKSNLNPDEIVAMGAARMGLNYEPSLGVELRDNEELKFDPKAALSAPEELTDTLKQMQRTFRYCGVYLAVVPSYIGGFMALTWVSQDAILGDPAKWTGLETAFAASRIRTDYYTPAIHRAAFALPAWIERLVR